MGSRNASGRGGQKMVSPFNPLGRFFECGGKVEAVMSRGELRRKFLKINLLQEVVGLWQAMLWTVASMRHPTTLWYVPMCFFIVDSS